MLTLLDKTRVWLQYLLPQHALSRLAGRLTNSQHPKLKVLLIRKALEHYQIDLSEALVEDSMAYTTFNDFFTRQLKPEARPIDADPLSIISPADGQISQCGVLDRWNLIQAKGFSFDLLQLLGGETEAFPALKSGKFMTIYLSPKDYHRVHMPFAGKLKEMTYIPGRLFSVNQRTTQAIPQLFARNERLACIFETDFGPMAVVFVGAMLVASIVTTWAGTIAPRNFRKIQHWSYADEALYFEKGAELGHFRFGSTVVVILPKAIQLDSALQAESFIKMGERIGTLTGC